MTTKPLVCIHNCGRDDHGDKWHRFMMIQVTTLATTTVTMMLAAFLLKKSSAPNIRSSTARVPNAHHSAFLSRTHLQEIALRQAQRKLQTCPHLRTRRRGQCWKAVCNTTTKSGCVGDIPAISMPPNHIFYHRSLALIT